MTMEQDWLDSRLSAESYLPDEGFTARVVGSLPKRTRPVVSLRAAILCLTGFVACCLLFWQLPPLLQTGAGYLGSGFSVMFHFDRLLADLLQPMVLLYLGGLLIMGGLVVMQFSRRWS